VTDPSGTRVRLISGASAFAVVLPIFLFGSVWMVAALAFAAAIWGMHEFVSMALPDDKKAAFPLMVGLGLPLFFGGATSTGAAWPAELPRGGDLALLAMLLGVVVSASFFLFTAKTTEGLADRWARFVLGLAYVPLLLGLFPALRGLDGGRGWLWAPLLASWGGDIGGYFAGRALGKHKMLPLISPKKTWEGFAGGIGLAIVALAVFKTVFFGQMTWVDVVVLGVLGDLAGVFGDLIESMLKRTFGVKDSGRFLPGHGGMLDRIDSTIMALPVGYLWVVAIRPLLPA
jgi:phosphatidate cytidylyltransferase